MEKNRETDGAERLADAGISAVSGDEMEKMSGESGTERAAAGAGQETGREPRPGGERREGRMEDETAVQKQERASLPGESRQERPEGMSGTYEEAAGGENGPQRRPDLYGTAGQYEAEQRERERVRAERLKPLQTNFAYFSRLSLFFGLAYTFCLYKNPAGITYPLFVLAACVCGVLACRKLGCPIKRGSWFLLAAALALGIGTCRTAEWFLIAVNGLALVLLGCVFGIHQFYDDDTWNLGKYFSSILLYLCHALGQAAVPFQHFAAFSRQREHGKTRRVSLFLGGLLAAVPLLFVLVWLLGAADAVFSDLVHGLFQTGSWLRPFTLLHLFFMTAFGFLAMYCLICCSLLRPLKPETADRRHGEPIPVLACMGSVAVVYVVFCAIQIFYLFLGKGRLPEGYTYSSYARQGFFQLLFVAILNLIMVLCCLKYVRPDRVLNVLLTVICACTYVMLASAVYRMCLYVQVYHLTYLRLTTLWFLAMTAVLLAGVTLLIWQPRFPLFRFGLAVVTVFYAALVWAKPGEILGWDYVHHMDRGEVTAKDMRYLVYNLSADAAPAIASLELTREEAEDLGLWPAAETGLPEDWEEKSETPDGAAGGGGQDTAAGSLPNAWMQSYYELHAGKNYRSMGLRNYNFSLAKVRALIPEQP